MRKMLKKVVKYWPWPVTVNERYDRQTKAVLKKICKAGSICIDIGCYEGEILTLMQKYAPSGHHHGFEPIPAKYDQLKNKFGSTATIYPFALGDENKETTFNHVVSNPTYSGLKKRTYKGDEEIKIIPVQVRMLDAVISNEIPVRLIKIDVEGGEYNVLRGGMQTLKKWRPFIIFEHGVGGADKYGVSPGDVYRFLVKELGYSISLMEYFLKDDKTRGFTQAELEDQFWKGKNSYFIAIPN